MNYEELSNQQLKDVRASLPKYLNNCTPEQAITHQEVYAEQIRRYKAEVADYNRRATEATGLKHGDKVEATFASAFMSTCTFTGKVVYDKNGRLAIKTDRPNDAGRRITPINKAWHIRQEAKQ